MHYSITYSAAQSEDSSSVKLFEPVYAPLREGVFESFRGDQKLQARKCSRLDRLYQRVMNDLEKRIEAVGAQGRLAPPRNGDKVLMTSCIVRQS